MRILFCGCGYGAGNIGDDAILEGLVASFRRALPTAQLGVVSFSPSYTGGHLELDTCWGVSREEAIAAVRWSTHVVLGGGTLLAAKKGLEFALEFAADWIELALAMGRPVAALAVGVSDIEGPEHRRLAAEVWQALQVVTVRSAAEKTLAEGLGLAPDKVVVCADGAFACGLPTGDGLRRTGGPIAINLVNDEPDRVRGFAEGLAVALRQVRDAEPARRIVGVCSETRRHTQFDYEVTRSTVAATCNDGEVFAEYVAPQEFCKSLQAMGLVVTMRMHVMLFCARLGVPCIGVARESKMLHMASELGLPPPLSMESSPNDIKSAISAALRNPEGCIADRARMDVLAERAYSNAAVWSQREDAASRTLPRLKVRLRAKARWVVGARALQRASWRSSVFMTSRMPFLFPRCKCLW